METIAKECDLFPEQMSPLKERSGSFLPKYTLFQPAPIGRGPGISPTLSWKVDILGNPDLEIYWDCGKEGGDKSKVLKRKGDREELATLVTPFHVLIPPPRQKSRFFLRTQTLASPERSPRSLWLIAIPFFTVPPSPLLTFVQSWPLWL